MKIICNNIKSFYHPVNNYYDEIIKFLEGDKFDVDVISNSQPERFLEGRSFLIIDNLN